MIPNTAFSKDGFLIDQSKTAAVSFGRGTSDRFGCGWIALYNLMLAAGKPIAFLQACDAMQRYILFGGRLGTNPFTLRAYLRQAGFRSKTGIVSKKGAAQRAALCRCGILMYIHKQGAHFVAFSKENANMFRFYNAEYGNENHIMTMEGFLKQYAVFPFCVLYTI